jgi:hypothetical protein
VIRWLRIPLLGALLCGCAEGTWPPRPAGSLVATHLRVGEPDGVVVLHDEYRRMRPSDFGVRFAENDTELDDLWTDGRLSEPRPAVDFRARVVLAFAGPADCNSRTLEDVWITSSAEVLLEVESTTELCEQMTTFDPKSYVIVASLPRRALVVGDYVVRGRAGPSKTFTVHGPTPPSRPPGTAPRVAPPPPRTVLPAAHSRRGRVVSTEPPTFDGTLDEAAGVWVRDDAIWLPWHSAVEGVPDGHLLACDERGCVPGFVSARCEAPECPAPGRLLITTGPLRARVPWPTGEAEWNRLMRELIEDPVLAEILVVRVVSGKKPEAPTYPRPPAPRVGWLTNEFTAFAFEQSLGGNVGAFVRDGSATGGAELRLGFRWAPFASVTSGWAYVIREGAVGEMWGVDLHGRQLLELGAPGDPRRWTAIGLSVAADNPLGHASGDSRVRVPSLLGFVLPEAGVFVSSDAPASFYTAHAFPVAVLLSPRFALELRPSFTLLFASSRAPGGDALMAVSLSLVHR